MVDHFYHGIADWIRYDIQGAKLAPGFRHLDFSLAPGGLRGIVNDGSVSIAAAIVYVIVGTNQLAAFLVFAWLSFLGGILFFRAFSLTFPGANTRRYAYLMFFLPSLLFWTADVSKEAIMTVSLGLVSYGAAKILARRSGGYTLLIMGVAVGILIRPNELLLFVAGFVVAMMVSSNGGRRGDGSRRVLSLLVFGALLVLSAFLTVHYLSNSGGSLSLQQTHSNNAGNGGSGGIPYSTSPISYPRDIYEILFNPLPFDFHGFGELIAAGENTVIVIILLASLRQLRMVPRAAFARPYVMMCRFTAWGSSTPSPPSATSASSSGSGHSCSPSSSSSCASRARPRGSRPSTRGSCVAATARDSRPPSTPAGCPRGPRPRRFQRQLRPGLTGSPSSGASAPGLGGGRQ